MGPCDVRGRDVGVALETAARLRELGELEQPARAFEIDGADAPSSGSENEIDAALWTIMPTSEASAAQRWGSRPRCGAVSSPASAVTRPR